MKIEKDWTTQAGLRAAIVIVEYSSGSWHRCGYVAVQPGHPLHGVAYKQATDALKAPSGDEPLGNRGIFTVLFAACGDGLTSEPQCVFDVHGSITYSGGGKGRYPVQHDGLWWFGFDCAHAGDDEVGGRSLEYVIAECESLARQIIDRTIHPQATQ